MNYLLDTCTFIWLCAEPTKLSCTVSEFIDSPTADLYLSHISYLEIALKFTSGKLTLPSPPRFWIEEQTNLWQLKSLALDTEDIFRLTELPLLHKDPFDRLLVATAINHRMNILTPDPYIHAYPVSSIW